jgi:hypothetical protein
LDVEQERDTRVKQASISLCIDGRRRQHASSLRQ